ncbi:flagellar basal body P-ring protein FlgI [Halioxenophilus sp. WMMB6]|uniref:flagellar basal body P-ring protein FlgI n=1 Tax=Halioxenophilus sp. WMMB6 TaxID=3073815 RepID=UPI00295F3C77|nr:flagellar basal body P-ring protein FlgI [Halioxenophilus sp. WMMB6]
MRISSLFLALALTTLVAPQVLAERIKDITSVQGVRSNQLIGYGLVVGLDGTGDTTNQSPFTAQSFNSMLKQFGISIPDGTRMKLDNIAAVAVHAELPAFAKPGQPIDITVSSIGNSGSLRGGSLLMTPLKGIDGEIYAIAQGNLVVGGLGVDGADGSRITVNVPSVGRIPGGAMVERAVPLEFAGGRPLILNLHQADFTTAKRVADVINQTFGPETAYANDPTSIVVAAPVNAAQKVDFISMVENLEVDPGQGAAKVVINSRTGTIIVGSNVTVEPVAITHGSLTVTIRENPEVSQPGPLSTGDTVVVPRSEIVVEDGPKPMFKFAPGSTLDDIVRAVNEVGAAPGDLMAILEALKQAGALHAELVVI